MTASLTASQRCVSCRPIFQVVCSTSEYPHAITHVNEAWTALCGFTPEEALGKTCGLLQGPRTAESAKEAASRRSNDPHSHRLPTAFTPSPRRVA